MAPRVRRFKLRGILMWTISNYFGYGLIFGLCMYRYKGCTSCGQSIDH